MPSFGDETRARFRDEAVGNCMADKATPLNSSQRRMLEEELREAEQEIRLGEIAKGWKKQLQARLALP